MDKMGRKKFFIIVGFIMVLTCIIFGYYYYRMSFGIYVNISWLVIMSFIIYIIGFFLGWGFIFMLVMLEIFFVLVRGVVSGIVIFINWFCAFFIIKEFIAF